jgi:hypothetical protein
MKALQGMCRLSKAVQALLATLSAKNVRVDAGIRQTEEESSVFVSVGADEPTPKQIEPA